jgi:hypothetical protein
LRSYEKLTTGGMAVPAADATRSRKRAVRLGGAATDCQLREEKGPDGSAHLLVHPALGAGDLGAAGQAFLEAIGAGAERIMGLAWRDAGFQRVERQAPGVTDAGEILHLHRARPGRAERSLAGR